jgi:hypothetical protein
LENGTGVLEEVFQDIRLVDYPDCLVVNKVEPIIRYIQSYTKLADSDKRTSDLRKYLRGQITDLGSIKITKKSGLFIASKR